MTDTMRAPFDRRNARATRRAPLAARAALVGFVIACGCGGNGSGGTGGDAAAGTSGHGGSGGTGTGGTTGAAGTTGSAGAGGTTGSAGTGGGGGAALCGARPCTSSELCVHPSCGGVAPACTPVPDGGQCPSGYTFQQSCPLTSGTVGPGCQVPPCTPPSPYCLTTPAACGATPTCSCLPSDVCHSGGACGVISKSDVLCISA